jgi:hypothetical protein
MRSTVRIRIMHSCGLKHAAESPSAMPGVNCIALGLAHGDLWQVHSRLVALVHEVADVLYGRGGGAWERLWRGWRQG